MPGLGLKLCSVLHNKPAEQTQLARVKQVEAEEEEKIKKRFVPKLKAISFHSFWQRELRESSSISERINLIQFILCVCDASVCVCLCLCVLAWLIQ